MTGENVELGMIHDDRFYFEDGDIILQVQNTLFKVYCLHLSPD